jgi:hypothetical protein
MCSDSSAGPAAKQPKIMVDPIWIATFEMGNRHCTGSGHVIDLHFPSICQPASASLQLGLFSHRRQYANVAGKKALMEKMR